MHPSQASGPGADSTRGARRGDLLGGRIDAEAISPTPELQGRPQQSRAPRRNATVTCAGCGFQFRPERSTARFCSAHCRKSAQRARERGIPVGVPATRLGEAKDAGLSVTAPVGISGEQKFQSVTLRRKPPQLDPRIVPDPKWPGMYRVRRPDGSLSDMVNLARAKHALAELWRGRP
jgi:hypothetical protein